MSVGNKPNPNYDQKKQDVTEEEKNGEGSHTSSKEIMILSEIPRFLSEVKAFYELNPTEFNGGIQPKGRLNKVQSRYMEGVIQPKINKEEITTTT